LILIIIIIFVDSLNYKIKQKENRKTLSLIVNYYFSFNSNKVFIINIIIDNNLCIFFTLIKMHINIIIDNNLSIFSYNFFIIIMFFFLKKKKKKEIISI